jgi:SARP family transcriptional regulator, regulator of embCAB operon
METTVAATADTAVSDAGRAVGLDVRLLGPQVARLNGRSFLPTAAKPRQVLALLAIRAGRLVTITELTEELWGTDAPRSAIATIQSYILKLRRHLAEAMPAARDILVTRAGGYVLDIASGLVDVNRYQDMATTGERALGEGDYETSSRLLGAALETWRGPALMDLPTGFLLGIEVTRLEQSRLSVLESRIKANLCLGRHHQLLEELAELTARYPMHEALCAQYMTALSACGLKWRALETFCSLRKTLVRELGIEPSLQLQRLQREILRSGTRLDESAAAWPTSTA